MGLCCRVATGSSDATPERKLAECGGAVRSGAVRSGAVRDRLCRSRMRCEKALVS